jgi:rubrerythrin
MEPDAPPPRARSRRRLLAGGAAAAAGAGTAAVIASCGGSSKTQSVTTISTVQQQSDAAILNALLDLEHSAIVAYEVATGRLSGAALAEARRFLSQERLHADAVARMIRRVAGTPQPPRATAEYESTFPPLRSAVDALGFALDIESTAVSAYADAIPKLASPGARTLAAAILTTESEHMAVVLGRLHRPQVPQPFVTGPPPQPEST